MATKTVTGKVTGPDGTAKAGVVRAVLSQPCTIPGTQEVVASVVSTTAAADGTYSLTLQANNDLTPNGTYYTVTETTSDGGYYSATIIVPQTAGPFVLSSILSGVTPTASPAVGHLSTLTVDALTATDVVYADTAGLVATDPTFTFNKTTKLLSATAATLTGALTAASAAITNAITAASGAFSGAVSMLSATFAGKPWFDVTHPTYGAKGDGTTDDGPAINAALTAANTGAYPLIGGIVYMPRGTYLIKSQLVVPFRVSLVGAGRDTTTIKADPTFPINTALVYLGDKLGGIGMGCRVENLTVACNNVAGSIGVYSERINEQSGVFRVLVQDCVDTGIKIAQPASGQPPQNYSIDDVEVIPGTGAVVGTKGVFMANTSITSTPRLLSRITVVSTTTKLTTAIQLDGIFCRVSDIHIENATNGILVGTVVACGGTQFINITGLANVTNLLVWSAAQSQNPMSVIGIYPQGATNSLVDSWTGNTLTGIVGFYAYGTGAAAAAAVSTTDINVVQRLNRVQVFKDLRRSSQFPVFATPLTVDATAGEIVGVGVLTAPITINAPTNPAQGQVLYFIFTQDGTGGRAITWNAAFKTAWQPLGGASAVSAVSFIYDGTNWQQLANAIPVDAAGNVQVRGTFGSLGNATFSATATFSGYLTPATLALGTQGNGIFFGSGVPSNASANNGDWYFRTDVSAAGARLYHKEAGAWVATAT